MLFFTTSLQKNMNEWFFMLHILIEWIQTWWITIDLYWCWWYICTIDVGEREQSTFYCDNSLVTKEMTSSRSSPSKEQSSRHSARDRPSKRTHSLPPRDHSLKFATTNASSTTNHSNHRTNTTPTSKPEQPKSRLFGNLVNRISRQQSGGGTTVNEEPELESCAQCITLKENLIAINHDKFALEDEVKVKNF